MYPSLHLHVSYLWYMLLFEETIICYLPQSAASKPLCVSHLHPKLLIYHLKNLPGRGIVASYCLHFYIPICTQQTPCIRVRFSLRWKLLTLSRTEPISASHSLCPSNTVALQLPLVYFFLWRAWFFKHVCFTQSSSWFLTFFFFSPQTCKENINREY